MADPQGSGLYQKVKSGCMWSQEEREGRRKRGQMDSVVEGVGLNRMTKNLGMVIGDGAQKIEFNEAVENVWNVDIEHETESDDDEDEEISWIDDAERVMDVEAVYMSRFLTQNEGLFLGSSSAVNLVACIKTVRKWHKQNPTSNSKPVVVTFLCDSGTRHLNKFWNDDYLKERGLDVPDVVTSLDFIK